MENVVVSIACCCYNHEAYISRTLEGFVMQKTQFPFEVIVHDDASNDRSAEIILEFASRYPDIIKPIIQAQNQYSKGVQIYKTYVYPNCKGKYVAFCEGDDYWTDESKLQLQVDYLEKHKEYIACTHNTEFIDAKTSKRKIKYGSEDKDFSLNDVAICGGQAYHTSSLVVRTEYTSNRPKWVEMIDGVGDYPCSIFYTLSGKVRYLGKVMSVYNVGTAGSWTERMKNDKSAKKKQYEQMIAMLTMANKYYNYKYNEIFAQAIVDVEISNLLLLGKYKDAKKAKYIETYRRRPLSERAKIMIMQHMPFIHKLYRIVFRRS